MRLGTNLPCTCVILGVAFLVGCSDPTSGMPRQVRLPDDEEEATATPPGAISGAAPQAQTASSAAQTQPIPSPTVSAPPAASPPAVVQEPAPTVTPASNAGPV